MKNYVAMGAVIVAGIVSLAVHAQQSRLGQVIPPKATVHRNADIPIRNVNELTRKSRQITDFIEEVSASVVSNTEVSTQAEIEAEELCGLYCEAVASLPEKCR